MARGISAKSLAPVEDNGLSVGAPPFIYHKNISGVAADETIEIVSKSEFKFRVIDCWAVANADMPSSETLRIDDMAVDAAGAPDPNAIVTAFAIGAGGNETGDIFRAAEINAAYNDIDKGGGLQVFVNYNSVTVEADVYVMCVRV